MIELPLIFVAGLLGSAHCLGMCGGFTLAVGSHASTWQGNALRQFLYTAGRVFTYAVLGAIAGYCGLRLTSQLPLIRLLPAVLAVAAGGILVYQGLLATGWLRKRAQVGPTTCLAGSFFSPMLGGPRLLQSFLAGVFTGLLPCGLLYGMLALAASSGAMLPAMAIMVIFALGTAPAMILTGLSGSLVKLAWRKPLFRFAGVCLIVLGAISVARGAGLALRTDDQTPACPFCDASK
jgi:hypothetical protein